MLKKNLSHHQNSLFSSLSDLPDQRHLLYYLTDKINRDAFEQAFSAQYSSDNARPAKQVHLMCELLILKHLRNLSDEPVVEQWSENACYQYFCGCREFTPSIPCDATDSIHFRHRIDEKGIELIFGESIRVNNDDLSGKDDKSAFIDSAVQEKNITYPTDSKLHRKIIRKCLQISRKESLPVCQSYSRTLKDLSLDQ